MLSAFSKPSNDNFWPAWPSYAPIHGRASRFVIDGTEAKKMVSELRKLYVHRQRSIMTELANRSHASSYGCVSPTNPGKKIFEDYAADLGLSLTFGQPGAPSIPNS